MQFIGNCITSILAFCFASIILAIEYSAKYLVIKPICFLCKKSAASVRAFLNKPKTLKSKPEPKALFTPAIFKDATNLGPAKEFRL